MATTRTTARVIAENQALTGDTYLPSGGLDVSAYLEGTLYLKLDVTDGTWAATVESYDTKGGWYQILDAFGASTSRSFTTATDDQQAVWQLRTFGKLIRVKLDGTGATQNANVNQLVFVGKA